MADKSICSTTELNQSLAALSVTPQPSSDRTGGRRPSSPHPMYTHMSDDHKSGIPIHTQARPDTNVRSCQHTAYALF